MKYLILISLLAISISASECKLVWVKNSQNNLALFCKEYKQFAIIGMKWKDKINQKVLNECVAEFDGEYKKIIVCYAKNYEKVK